MNWRRYLIIMGTSWAAGAVLLVSFNVLVNPLGLSPIGVSAAGLNARKPLRYEADGLVKRLDVRHQGPTTIFMGSSRIKQAVDPNIAGAPFIPAYNAGLDGVAGFGEQARYLHDYLERDRQLRYVFIEVFPTAQLSPGTAAVMARLGRADDIADYASSLFSVSGLRLSARTVSMNRQSAYPSAAPEATDGYAPIPLAPHHFSVRNVFNFVVYTQRLWQPLDPEFIHTASAMLDECRTHGVRCRFFLSPLHADVLFAIYRRGLWPELEALKRGLSKLEPTYDFTGYSNLIDERTGPVVYWPEAFHFSPALGELLTRTMTGTAPPDIAQNFGLLLDADNVETHLSAWRNERDRWIASHPDAERRMRQAEDNFRLGKTFAEVTQAELAAGGW